MRLPWHLHWLTPKHLFAKYVLSFVGLVIFVLAASGVVETYFLYRETVTSLVRRQAEKADAASSSIEQSFADLERNISWATRASSNTIDLRRSDYQQLLRTNAAVAGVVLLDGSGHEALRLSRDYASVGSNADYSKHPGFLSGSNGRSWFGPAFFENGMPYMLIVIPHAGSNAGMMVAQIDLRFLSDYANSVQTAQDGTTLIVSNEGRLIARSKTSIPAEVHSVAAGPQIGDDLSNLPQVKALRAPEPHYFDVGRDFQGNSVLFASAKIPTLQAAVFVEQPRSAAFHPVYELLLRLLTLSIVAVVLSVIAGIVLARRMSVPIQALKIGAARLGAGDFTQKIEVKTGDEIEVLADEFNHMARQIQDSYSALEQKVEERTRDLAQTVSELRALAEIGRAVASSLDLQRVLATVVTHAVELASADGGAIYAFDERRHVFQLAEAHGLDRHFIETVRQTPIADSATSMGEAARGGAPLVVCDLSALGDFPLREPALEAGFRSLLVVPLVGVEGVLGALVVLRHAAGGFSHNTIGLMQIFADQSVLAMHNARLFKEVEEKGRQLAIASEHKSQFFANMSHELRTPLNAVLGYTELLADGLYGEIPERAKHVLQRVQINGTHLLALINDVLDLSKIDAGELRLELEEYSLGNLIETVVAQAGSLAEAKRLSLANNVADGLPKGAGDERRLSQVLLNIVSNAIKFTEHGSVTISASSANGMFEIAIRDTGPGIAPEDQARIFQAFQQVDNSNTRKKGGTGLGLSISRRLIEMHGGTIEVESTVGVGSAFYVRVPVRVGEQREAA
jgi:signal transduction histidine kinase